MMNFSVKTPEKEEYLIEADSFKIVENVFVFLVGKHPDTRQVAAFPTFCTVVGEELDELPIFTD